MVEVTQASPRDESFIDLDLVSGALVSCDYGGRVLAASPSARDLLARMGMEFSVFPGALDDSLWRVIAAQDVGEAIQWRSPLAPQFVLGCTRYSQGPDAWLLVMREISQKHNILAQQLHQQRLEALGRLMATTAHDLRAPLASILFNADVLGTRFGELSAERMREMIGDVRTAAARLRGAIDCMLDYARVGPAIAGEVSLSEVLQRVQSLLRPHLRAGDHVYLVESDAGTDQVLGNVLAIEQIFLNLVLNAIEAARGPITVRIGTSREGQMLRVLVEDNGPGIPPDSRFQVFEPFFTTKPDGTGIGLAAARDAARSAGGDLELVRWNDGAAFAVLLPAAIAEGAR